MTGTWNMAHNEMNRYELYQGIYNWEFDNTYNA